jgi:3-methyladenine DNA glycosylase Tag
MTVPFKTIRARAEKRKGGPKALGKLLPPKPDPKSLAKLGDDRILAEMTKRVFSAGFAWSVIENKWDGFEKAFLSFKPGPLTLQPDEFWDGLMLRFLGWDGFVTSKDMVACLRDAGLDIAETITSKRDLAKVQAQLNAWAEETGLAYTQLSRICAMSIGENYSNQTLARFVGGDHAP